MMELAIKKWYIRYFRFLASKYYIWNSNKDACEYARWGLGQYYWCLRGVTDAKGPAVNTQAPDTCLEGLRESLRQALQGC